MLLLIRYPGISYVGFLASGHKSQPDVAQNVWVRLDDPLKEPLLCAYQDDYCVDDLVGRVLKREKESVRSSDVKAYVKRGADDDEVEFTEKVSQIEHWYCRESFIALIASKGERYFLHSMFNRG
jgi:hypothetical protein